MTYIHVILPLRLEWTPSYCTEQELHPGQIVRVSFSGRSYLGVVWHCGIEPDVQIDKIQPIQCIEEGLPEISGKELKLWEFIASYYLCSIGEVYKAACPSQKLRSEQSAADSLERLKAKLARLEADLGKKHCERVRLRLEAEKQETLARINGAEFPGLPVPKATAAGKPLLIKAHQRNEIYRKHIREALQQGRQVLILCPETAFCEKMHDELRKEFEGQLHIVHAEQTAARKRKAAEELRAGKACVVVGARSSVFLPFSSLGLVIIDEEQDVSYKQSEPAPRYNGRDCAIFLAGLHSAQVLLGSACPSLESLYNCLSGKFELMQTGDTGGHCEVIDLSAEQRKNGVIGIFSRKAIETISRQPGKLHIVRGWEKEEDVREAAAKILPGIDVSISRLGELKREGSRGASTILVLQADALVDKDDFRSDERALQLISLLRSMCSTLIIQTKVPQRFDPDKDSTLLLEERRLFSFPPYSRMIDKKRKGSGEVLARHFLKKGQGLSEEKNQIARNLEPYCYLDVDPQ